MKTLVMFLCLSVVLTAFAKSGDEVRNGGGFAEQYLTYALRTMPKKIERCLTSMFCARGTNQRELPKKIKASIAMEIDAEF